MLQPGKSKIEAAAPPLLKTDSSQIQMSKISEGTPNVVAVTALKSIILNMCHLFAQLRKSFIFNFSSHVLFLAT